jgi:rare lipoprotein A
MKFGLILASALFVTLSGCSDTFFRDGGPRGTFNPDSVTEIEPRFEPLSPGGNPASYSVFGKQYQVMKSSVGFVQRGDASWYGTKFHGNKTSNGERYNMYAISAAHKSLPIPSYVEVTNLENGRRLIVRVNDRGPFHSGRIIDLSYAAAAKLGYADKGTAPVEIRVIDVAQYQREKLRTTAVSPPSQVTVTPLPNNALSIAMKATPLPVVDYTERAEKVAAAVDEPLIKGEATAQLPTEQPATAADSPQNPVAKSPAGAAPEQIYIQLGAFSNRTNAEQIAQQSTQAQISKAGEATIQPVSSNSKIVYRVRLGPFTSDALAEQILQHLLQQNIGEPRIFRGS